MAAHKHYLLSTYKFLVCFLFLSIVNGHFENYKYSVLMFLGGGGGGGGRNASIELENNESLLPILVCTNRPA